MHIRYLDGKENFYAFALSIVAGYTSDKALSTMGLLKSRGSEKQKASHPTKIKLCDKEKVRQMYLENKMSTIEIAKLGEWARYEFEKKRGIRHEVNGFK